MIENKELTQNKTDKIREIISNNDLNINVSSDDFYIIDTWQDLDKLVSVYNNVPLNYINYGRVDLDRVLDNEIEFFSIDDILNDSYGFSDENIICDECNIHVCTTPGFYGDIPQYTIMNDTLLCGECVKNNHVDEYIEGLINNPKNANILLSHDDLIDNGFNICNCKNEVCAFESGFHHGQTDNPDTILKNAIAKNPDKEYVFMITSIGQFDVNYTIYSRKINNEESD